MYYNILPGACTTKHFTTVINLGSLSARMFTVSHFDPGLIFTSKAGLAFPSGLSSKPSNNRLDLG